MIEFKTSKGSFVADEVDSSENAMYMFFENPKIFKNGIYLKPMFLISDVTEEDAKLVVDSFELYGGVNVGYKNYTEDEPVLDTTLESLHSLLKSKGIDINTGNWYLFKKI